MESDRGRISDDMNKCKDIEDNMFRRLPLELLTKILSHFETKKELDVLILVCKQWFQTIESKHGLNATKRITLNYDRIGENENLQHTFRKFGRLTVTKQWNKSDQMNRLTMLLASIDLFHLELKGFNTHEMLTILAQVRSTVSSVILHPGKDCNTPINEIHLPCLKSLEILMTSMPFIRNPLTFVKVFTNLTSLKFEVNREEHLTTLRMLASLNTLQKLTLNVYVPFESEDSFQFLKTLKALNAICIDDWPRNCDTGIVLKNLPSNLEIVKLGNLYIPEDFLKNVHKMLPNLKSIICDEIDFQDILKYPVSRFLRNLKIEGYKLLPNLDYIQQNLNLAHLEIWLGDITADILETLLEKFPAVENLNVYISKEIELYEALFTISKWKNLKSLRLQSSGCNSTKPSEIISFLRLEKLYLAGPVINYFFDNVSTPNVRSISTESRASSVRISDQSLLSRFPSRFENVREFSVTINIENAVILAENIDSGSFTGKLYLEDSNGGKDKGQIYLKWKEVVGKIARHFKLPPSRLWTIPFHGGASGSCAFKTDLITLEIFFFA